MIRRESTHKNPHPTIPYKFTNGYSALRLTLSNCRKIGQLKGEKPENPQILDLVFKIAPISDLVAKFRGDRPRDRGDIALNKKKKKETAVKQKGRVCVITQRAAIMTKSFVIFCWDGNTNAREQI